MWQVEGEPEVAVPEAEPPVCMTTGCKAWSLSVSLTSHAAHTAIAVASSRPACCMYSQDSRFQAEAMVKQLLWNISDFDCHLLTCIYKTSADVTKPV